MTLLEILVVVAIMGLIAAGVGVAAFKFWKGAQEKTALTGARTIRSAVKSYWVMSGTSGCPTVAELVRGGALDEDSPRADPWGSPWRIECTDDQVSVGSDGPDRTQGTADDIRVPPLHRGADPSAPDSTS